METASYEVRNQKGKVVGYIDRQGEDSRLMSPERDDRVRSFFPWSAVLQWAEENSYKLENLQQSEPVVVVGE